jgi:hypothetical protein
MPHKRGGGKGELRVADCGGRIDLFGYPLVILILILILISFLQPLIIRVRIKISLHANILAGIGTMNPPLLDRPPLINSCPSSVPSPLPSDGRGEG